MKRILLFAFILGFLGSSFAQTKINVPKQMRNKAAIDVPATAETMNFNNFNGNVVPAPVNYKYLVSEAEAGQTVYDLQTNSAMQDRIYKYDDGTVGVTWTIGFDAVGLYPGRGTGYNYFDGSTWGPIPTERIEADRTGWPAYAPFGENGEIAVAHYSGAATDGLAFMKREEKGSGAWDQFDFIGPTGAEGLLWPRMTTGGTDHSVIHLLPITKPYANGGPAPPNYYEGIDGALLYCRSTDGGETWDPENELLDEINSDYVTHFSGDTYEIRARGDVVAILAGDGWTDLILLKSTDGGDSWEKTIVWENPYPLFDLNALIATDTFYCPDGAHALTIDQGGKVHVAFGINRAQSDGAGTFWFPLVDGLGYWNEDRPTFSSDLNSLCPYSDCSYTELQDDYSLIGWAQDINENGVWDILGEPGYYYLGTSSMPTITVDDQNRVIVIYAGLTETYNNGLQDYRHLWGRMSQDGGENWGPFVDLSSDLIHIFDECVFPNMSQSSDDNVYLAYQYDTEPGLSVRGDEDDPTDNTISFMQVAKDELVGVREYSQAINTYDVSAVSPNPANNHAKIDVNVRIASSLSLEVTNMMGQVVMTLDKGNVSPGMTTFKMNTSLLRNGVYFCTVKAGETSVTKKMIIE